MASMRVGTLQALADGSPRVIAQRRTLAGTVQRAGTKPNQPSQDGQWRIKLSSDREAFSYTNQAMLGLNGLLPAHEVIPHDPQNNRLTLNASNEITHVTDQHHNVIPLATPIPAPTGTQSVLLIRTVGFDQAGHPGANTTGNDKLFIDVKIGTYTKSGEQFNLEGANWFWQQCKKIEHNMKDWNRDSRTLGYDIDAGNRDAFYAAMNDGAKHAQVKAAMATLIAPLGAIDLAMQQAPVTFVGSSLFIVLNLTDPGSSEVKLIDPDHPIVISEDLPPNAPALNEPADVMTTAKVVNSGRNATDYKNKWKGGFNTGMTNFQAWFTQQRNRPAPTPVKIPIEFRGWQR